MTSTVPAPVPAPEIISRYFEYASRPDAEAYFGLFADDAVVEDEGKTYHGIAEIRRWRGEVPLVSYEITDVEQTPEGTVVTATVTGNFPGSPFAGLRFRFAEYDDNRIGRLRIAP